MECPPSPYCFEVAQMHARPVPYQLATNLQHDCILSLDNVLPRETQYLPPAKTQRQSQHVGRLQTIVDHRFEEDLSLFGSKRSTLSMIKFRTLCYEIGRASCRER